MPSLDLIELLAGLAFDADAVRSKPGCRKFTPAQGYMLVIERLAAHATTVAYALRRRLQASTTITSSTEVCCFSNMYEQLRVHIFCPLPNEPQPNCCERT
jgi:hypothetical protein